MNKKNPMDVQTEPDDYSSRTLLVTAFSSIFILLSVLLIVYPMTLILPVGFGITEITIVIVICVPALVIGNVLIALRARY